MDITIREYSKWNTLTGFYTYFLEFWFLSKKKKINLNKQLLFSMKLVYKQKSSNNIDTITTLTIFVNC